MQEVPTEELHVLVVTVQNRVEGFVHPCCTSVSRMILKTNSDYSYTDNKLSLDRISQHPCEMGEQTELSLLDTHLQFIYCQGNNTFLHIILFSFRWPRKELRVLFITS